jgi:hypothetical protein
LNPPNDFVSLDDFSLDKLKSKRIFPLPPKPLTEMTLEEFDLWLISLSSEARIRFISDWTSEIFTAGYSCGGNA